jgi:hypothetical protein
MKSETIVKEITSKLKETEIKSQSPNEFEDAIKNAFDFLGFDAELIGGSGDTDVILTANIGKESYKVTVDGKTSVYGKINDGGIDWLSLKDHKQKNQADFVVVIGPAFSGGNLEKRANDHGICLLKTDELIQLVNAHSEFPFTLFDLKNLFTGKGERSSQLNDLKAQNSQKKGFLNQFKTVIDEMQAIQDGKLGYFTDASLTSREKIEDLEIEHDEIKSIIKLLELPFIRAIETLSPNEYILTLGNEDLANIFTQISKILILTKESIIDTIPAPISETVIQKETKFAFKYYKWAIKEETVTAYARKEDPYVHNCPRIHFINIIKIIIEVFKNQDLVNQDIIFSHLEGKELAPDRIFKGKAEHYKIYMALAILEIKGLIKWTGSKRPVEFKLNAPVESLKKWLDDEIIQIK